MAKAIVLAALLFCSGVQSVHLNISLDDWSSLPPSSEIHWVPCFQNYSCARLEVPLDCGDPSRGVTAITFLQLSATNATSNTRSLLINPGGPGGSGIESVYSEGPELAGILQGQHNIVGFDPRGVGLSGPSYPEIYNASSTAAGRQFAAAEIFGDACGSTVGGSNGSAAFANTPAVARDMLSFVEAEQKQRLTKNESVNEQAKLWYYEVPNLAAIVAGLEQGNTTAYAITVTGGTIPANPCNYNPSTATTDVDTLIKCVDGAAFTSERFRNISQFEGYVDVLTSQS
ncbi:hypothetical protein BDW72DRAFT_189625 [Aspergillus terricola var. indicus]